LGMGRVSGVGLIGGMGGSYGLLCRGNWARSYGPYDRCAALARPGSRDSESGRSYRSVQGRGRVLAVC
jgi:hypothetical protein